MANDIAYGLVLLVFVGAVVAYVYWPRPPQTVVRERTGPTTVLVEPTLTPLRDSGPANNARRRSGRQSSDAASPAGTRRPVPSRGTGGHHTAAPAQPSSPTGTKKAPRKRKTPARPSPPAPSQPAPQSQPPPSQQPAVTVPLPSVCTGQIQVGTCP